MTGFATSIDAMAVGIGLAFMDVHIGVMAAVIGLCTLTMVTAGIMLGRVLGSMVGKRAEIIGGVILVIIGATILYEHLHGVGEQETCRAEPTLGCFMAAEHGLGSTSGCWLTSIAVLH